MWRVIRVFTVCIKTNACFLKENQCFTSDLGKLPVPLHLGIDKYFFFLLYLGKYTENWGEKKAVFLIVNAICIRRG